MVISNVAKNSLSVRYASFLVGSTSLGNDLLRTRISNFLNFGSRYLESLSISGSSSAYSGLSDLFSSSVCLNPGVSGISAPVSNSAKGFSLALASFLSSSLMDLMLS